MAGTVTAGQVKVIIKGDAKELFAVLQKVKKEFESLDGKVQMATKHMSSGMVKFQNVVSKTTQVLSGLLNSILSLKSIMVLLGVGVVGKSVLDTALTFNKWALSLEALTGSASESLRVQEMLKQQADELGQRYVVLIEQYTKFRGAAEMAGMKLQDVEKTFRAVSKAAVVFQLDAKDTYEVFRALTQMLSKGTISAEELRGQFGERIPGALAIMANALGVTLSTLLKLMENGELLADVVIPKMSDGLEETFGAKVVKVVNSAQAELNRFMNVIDNLKNKIAVGGALEKFTETLERLGNYLSREDVGYELAQIASGLMTLFDAIVRFGMLIMSLPREVFGILFGGSVGGLIGGAIGAIGGPPGILAGGAIGSAAGAALGGIGMSLTRFSDTEMPRIIELAKEMKEVQDKIKDVESGFQGSFKRPLTPNERKEQKAVLESELKRLQEEYNNLFKSEDLFTGNAENQLELRYRDIKQETELLKIRNAEEKQLIQLKSKLSGLEDRLVSQLKVNEEKRKAGESPLFSRKHIMVTLAEINKVKTEMDIVYDTINEKTRKVNEQRTQEEKQVYRQLTQIQINYKNSIGNIEDARILEVKQNAKEELDKLAEIKAKGYINEQEYEKQLKLINSTTQNNITAIHNEETEKRMKKRQEEHDDAMKKIKDLNKFMEERTKLINKAMYPESQTGMGNYFQNRDRNINQETTQYLEELKENGSFTYEHMIALTEKYKENLKVLADKELYYKAGEYMTDAIVDPLMQAVEGTKKLSDAFREMTQSILRDLARLAMRQAFLGFLGMAFGGGGAAVGSAAGTSTNLGGGQYMGVGGSVYGMGVPTQANGGVWNRGSLIPFAKGGIVNRPTLFGMKGGVGLMGESGPEAIMPLKRGRNGKLGIAGGGVNISNNIVIENGGQMADDPEKMNSFAAKIGEEIRNQVRSVIMDEQRVNGVLNSAAIRRYA